MNGNKSVTANFTQQFTLTTAANPSNGGSVSGAGTYSSGTQVAVTHTANTDWTFTGWSGDCSGAGSCSVTMNGNKSVTANFIAAPVARISMSSGGQTVIENQTLSLTVATGGTANVSFSAAASYDLDGFITGHQWKINGSTVSNFQSFNYDLDGGIHQIFLTVTDNDGLTKSVGATVVVTESEPLATIVGFAPSSAVSVGVGGSVTLSVTFKNTGVVPWDYTVGTTVWNSSGQQVANYSSIIGFELQPGQPHIVNWAHTVGSIGNFWVQFGVWKATPFTAPNLLDRDPSPSQLLIVGQKFSINARVRTTANLNIRILPGTGNPEISGSGYPGFAPSGATGTVKDGPISSDGYVWWRIQFDAGYTGWGADNWLEGL
jgi:uncharacterized repeat protein (TIGR02543 family)